MPQMKNRLVLRLKIMDGNPYLQDIQFEKKGIFHFSQFSGLDLFQPLVEFLFLKKLE